jgi:hypothetical protein
LAFIELSSNFFLNSSISLSVSKQNFLVLSK